MSTKTYRDVVTKKPPTKTFMNEQRVYITEAYYDQDPGMPAEWRRTSHKNFRSRRGAIDNAKWAMKLQKQPDPLDACRTAKQIERMRAGKFSKLRVVEIVYTKTSEQVIETIQ